MKTVAVAGSWDPLHPYHLTHMRLARQLGDRLVVIVQNDEGCRKKCGYVVQTMRDRMALIEPYPFVYEVIPNIDDDGSCTETLRRLRPDIFVKGADRNPENMPAAELQVCREIGCLIVYGIGPKGGSSRAIVLNLLGQVHLHVEGFHPGIDVRMYQGTK